MILRSLTSLYTRNGTGVSPDGPALVEHLIDLESVNG